MTNTQKARAAIEAQKVKEGLEQGVAELLTELAQNDFAAGVIAEDLGNADMSIAKCAERLAQYARAHKKSSCYCMTQAEARRLIEEFYGLGKTQAPAAPPPADGVAINLLDFLG